MPTGYPHEGQARLRAAWQQLCESLVDLPESVLDRPGCPSAPHEQAEGYRYLTRQVRLALDDFLEHADPLIPELYLFTTPSRKTGIDNPDTIYLTTAVSADSEYRVHGNRGTIAYVAFGLYSGFYGSNQGMETVAHYHLDTFDIDPTGEFEIILGGNGAGVKNWIPLPSGVRRFDVRQTALAKDEVAAKVRVDLLARGPAPTLSAHQIATGLEESAQYIGNGLPMWAEFVTELQTRPNQFRDIARSEAADLLSNMDTFYASGYWSLREGESLLVDIDAPPCRYWSIQIASHWMESFPDRRSVLNMADVTPNEDGHIRVVIGPEDPGMPNWLCTKGYVSGTMTVRAILAERPIRVKTRVSGIDDVRSTSDGSNLSDARVPR